MATFNGKQALDQAKATKAQMEANAGAMTIAENIMLKAKIKTLEKQVNDLLGANNKLQEQLLDAGAGMSLTDIKQYAKSKAGVFGVQTNMVNKLSAGVDVLNWLDCAIWRKTEQKEIEDGLAD